MTLASLDHPVFATYAVSACLLILKMLGQAYLNVFRMMRAEAGFLNPEDARKTPLNPNPRPGQLDPLEEVERSRRMHRNDTENIPLFLTAGLLFALTDPPLWAAQLLMYGYVASRAAHFVAYATAQIHDVRAGFWTLGTLLLAVMVGWTLWGIAT
jgi:uncharacterized MAPEG superfamily protein